MENGQIDTITSAAIGKGTITPGNGPGPVQFDIAVVHGSWDQLFRLRPVRFTRSADPRIASYVEPA